MKYFSNQTIIYIFYFLKLLLYIQKILKFQVINIQFSSLRAIKYTHKFLLNVKQIP